jgi:hypothetical protein
MTLKPSPPAFVSRAVSKASSALLVIILLPVILVLTFKLLDRIGLWLFLGMVAIAIIRIVAMVIARRRQDW